MGEEPRGRYGYVPSPFASPKSSCQMQGPHSNALLCSPPVSKAAQPNPHSSLSTGSIPAGGAGEGQQKRNTPTEEKGEGCLIYSPHLPVKGSSCTREPSSLQNLYRAALEQGTRCTTGGKNLAKRCRPQLQKGMGEDTSSGILCPYPHPLWETAPMTI